MDPTNTPAQNASSPFLTGDIVGCVSFGLGDSFGLLSASILALKDLLTTAAENKTC